MNRLRVARLRRLYGLTEAQAKLYARLAFEGGCK